MRRNVIALRGTHMKWLEKLLGTKTVPPLPRQEWLLAYFPLQHGAFGSTAERDAAHQFADHLDDALSASGVGEYDGDEYGEGQGCLFMTGPDAQRMFAVVEPLLRAWPVMRDGYVLRRDVDGKSERLL